MLADMLANTLVGSDEFFTITLIGVGALINKNTFKGGGLLGKRLNQVFIMVVVL